MGAGFREEEEQEPGQRRVAAANAMNARPQAPAGDLRLIYRNTRFWRMALAYQSRAMPTTMMAIGITVTAGPVTPGMGDAPKNW
jgi:hypothetical protein